MKTSRICLLLLCLVSLAVVNSCTTDTDTTPATTDKTSGFITSTVAYSPSGSTYFAGYFDGMPSGQIDLTQKTAFKYIYPIATYKNAFFSQATDGTMGITKLMVDAAGKIIAKGNIPTASYIGGLTIINDNLGVYAEQSTSGKLFTFDPSTMTKTGEIDMTGAKVFDTNDANLYYNMVYRASDNRLFAPLYTSNSKTPQYYDATSIYVEVINLSTKKREKTIEFSNAMDPFQRGMLNPLIDETGNIFFLTQGSYGLDGKVGPTAPVSSKPQIIKIPAGTTDFDPSYRFNPVTALGFPNLIVQIAVGGIYDKNGIAYACVTAGEYPARVTELITKYAQGKATSAEIAELYQLVIYGSNYKWVKLDLNAKTVTAIPDMPFTAGFSYPSSYKYDGKLYFQMFNDTDKINGFYEFDPASGSAKSLFNVTAGGVCTNLVKLTP
ncbi:hypothetical protein GCM10028819_06100 [Spirosoma humi]